MKNHFLSLLQMQLFETLPRMERVDWTGLILLFMVLFLLMLLQYRNPNAITSMVARAFRETTKKLYFASPAIDTIDKLLFFGIYLTSGALCVHYALLEFELKSTGIFLKYFSPLIILAFWVLPLRFTAIVSGHNKEVLKILKRQMPVLFLTGIILIPFAILFYINSDYRHLLNFVVLGIMVSFVAWIHVRVIYDLILEQISIYYIFMYFCILEILPLFIIWIWISRL